MVLTVTERRGGGKDRAWRGTFGSVADAGHNAGMETVVPQRPGRRAACAATLCVVAAGMIVRWLVGGAAACGDAESASAVAPPRLGALQHERESGDSSDERGGVQIASRRLVSRNELPADLRGSAETWSSWSRPSAARAATPALAPTARPLRVLELVTGERLHVEWLRCDAQTAEFRWAGQTRFRLSRSLIAAVRNPPGERDVWDESFEQRPGEDIASAAEHAPHAAHTGRGVLRADRLAPPWRRALPPCAAARVSVWRRVAGAAADAVAGVVELEFAGTAGTEVLPVRCRSDGVIAAETPPGWRTDFRQIVRAPTAWTALQIVLTEAEFTVYAGDAVVLRGRKPPSALTAVAIRAGEPAATRGECWFDDIHVRQCGVPTAQAVVQQDPEAFAVWTADGDVLFGDDLRASVDELRLRGERGEKALRWSDIVAVDFPRAENPAADMAEIAGRIGWFVGPAAADRPELPPERWVGAARAVGPTWLGVDHCVLGTLWNRARFAGAFRPEYRGSFRWLDPRLHHLGDELHADWPLERPVREIGGSFALMRVPRESVSLSAEVSELEPSGPGTPLGQPFLQELRGGGLRTELRINERLVGDWNRLLTGKASIGKGVRVRLEVPHEYLVVGENTWRIRQQPLSPSDRNRDDCLFGRVALEVRD